MLIVFVIIPLTGYAAAAAAALSFWSCAAPCEGTCFISGSKNDRLWENVLAEECTKNFKYLKFYLTIKKKVCLRDNLRTAAPIWMPLGQKTRCGRVSD